MAIGLGQEFNLTGFCQFPEAVNDFRRIEPELFNCNAGKRECNFKFTPVLANQIQQQLVGRQVRFISYFPQNTLIGVIVIIVVIITDVEKTVCPEPEWLVDLKV